MPNQGDDQALAALVGQESDGPYWSHQVGRALVAQASDARLPLVLFAQVASAIEASTSKGAGGDADSRLARYLRFLASAGYASATSSSWRWTPPRRPGPTRTSERAPQRSGRGRGPGSPGPGAPEVAFQDALPFAGEAAPGSPRCQRWRAVAGVPGGPGRSTPQRARRPRSRGSPSRPTGRPSSGPGPSEAGGIRVRWWSSAPWSSHASTR